MAKNDCAMTTCSICAQLHEFPYANCCLHECGEHYFCRRCKKGTRIAKVNTDAVSDGYHTFGSLYHQRLILFAALVNSHFDISWKSKLHHDGAMPFGGGWFIVGMETPAGQYTYHYELKDWDLFHCKEVDRAPEWDGHTDKDVERLLSIC